MSVDVGSGTASVEVLGGSGPTEIEVLGQGPQGLQGIKGEYGASLRWGYTSPGPNDGFNGDTWFDQISGTLYGPKSGGIWPSPVSLKGLQGDQGIQGIQGNQGIQGVTGNTGNYYKNYIWNSGMAVSHQNSGGAGTTDVFYPVEGFYRSRSHSGVGTIQRVASLTPGGSPYRLRVTVGTAVTSPASGDYDIIAHHMEGIDAADLRLGTASAKQVTIQFGVKAPAGTYYVSLHNSAINRSYVAAFTITAGQANTDQQKSVTITLDTTGTWLTGEGDVGMRIYWSLMNGATYNGSINTWVAGNVFNASGAFNVLGSTSNVFELFDVSLTVGSSAPAYLVPEIADVWRKSARYWEAAAFNITSIQSSTSVNRSYAWPVVFKQRKAKTPTMSVANLSQLRTVNTGTVGADQDGFSVFTQNTAAGGDDINAGGTWIADARI